MRRNPRRVHTTCRGIYIVDCVRSRPFLKIWGQLFFFSYFWPPFRYKRPPKTTVFCGNHWKIHDVYVRSGVFKTKFYIIKFLYFPTFGAPRFLKIQQSMKNSAVGGRLFFINFQLFMCEKKYFWYEFGSEFFSRNPQLWKMPEESTGTGKNRKKWSKNQKIDILLLFQ